MSAETLTASIQESGKRIETIKAIQTIKVMAAEIAQESQWSNRYADYIRKTMKFARFNLVVGSVHAAVDTVITTVIIYLGAKAIIDGKMTVGILYPFRILEAR
ncbi:hypothetical protein ABENE_20910 [Asticcacaulis benevestitus DSM 16100 = ATCC BAA-896]|uniref:ABC transmembrane type-1 domain-containing protein n=2 Tax=Asticcacaulis TaxID=76890 RepID=V4QTG5_9CAUL|nr:hypothetical protein ABENE_20910 [Asticcacaulis benevestitus DSM 16100 = ATCC BAA-896]